MTQSAACIVIVTFHSEAEIAACLESTRATGADVLVIDNASADRTVAIAQAHGARVIANPVNAGFAAAANQGVRATTAPFILLLNPDTVLQTGIDALVEGCSSPDVGIAGGLLVSADGAPQRGFTVRNFPTALALCFEALLINRLWPRNPVNWRYRCLGLDLTQPADVHQPAGAFLMVRRDIWQRVGGFDEGFYPLWFEDVDFCKRVARAGFRSVYVPAAVAMHAGAHSVSQVELGKRTEYWYRSLLRYSIVQFRPGGRILTGLGVAAGALLRALFGGRKHWSPPLVRSYITVMGLAFRSIRTRKLAHGEPFV